MAPMTGVLQWRHTGSLGRTGWEDEEGCVAPYVRAVGMHGALPGVRSGIGQELVG